MQHNDNNIIIPAPRISIIVPVYNPGKYLRECIDSILAQTFSDFELILIDDGSTDSSPAICDNYATRDSRIHVIHQPNSGVSAARNAGLDSARGEWISFIDSDDTINPKMLETLLNSAINEKADIVMCDLYFEYENGERKEYKTYSWTKEGDLGIAEFIATPWTIICNTLHRKSLYLNGMIRCPEKISYCEDFHLIIRLLFNASCISKVNLPLYNYRQRSDSILHNQNQQTFEDELWAYEDIRKYITNLGYYINFKKTLSWRSLKVSQTWALDTKTFELFKEYNPDKKHYILNCPFLNRKMKIITWCLTHHLSFISAIIVNTRRILGR